MSTREMACIGECGRTWFVEDQDDQETVEVICEPCWTRLRGVPADGFVGFAEDGSHRTVRRLST